MPSAGQSEDQQRLDLGGRHIAYTAAGAGHPTVVLEAGATCARAVWQRVQEGVARFTRVVSYDRAGFGDSTPVPLPRTGDQMAADLHALLAHTAAPGPYVLVGHSLGGLLVRVYAQRYPAEVAGLVLVDAPHLAYPRRALVVLGPETASDCAEVRESRQYFASGIDDPAAHPEGVNLGALCAQVEAADGLGNRPLRVLTAGVPEPFSADFPPDLAVRILALVQELQRDLVTLSSRGTQVLATQSGHFIQADQPDLVINAIREVVALVQAG